MTSRPDELWILERTIDGMENWRPVETFLGNLQLAQDQRALRATANQWRLHYDVPPISPSTTFPLHPVLPHPVNTPMCTLDSLSSPFRTTPTYYNHAGDAPHSTTLRALLYRFIGHHGAQLLRLRLQEQQPAGLRHNL